ncbi:phosphoenolpyruvate-protein phosphotransferase PtsP [Pokkaliibacter plantistimulans]|uniref:phosphoenolpyruvate--protein phosphotransferase n=1 Tax=Proteobacteria bacterium 228 TaxID=2083153 RepID=A0A2S5KSD0_9PROT|nr:phosphoenolpyruvate--protein phosphotransferase [Pokkaliibacter plantistimulans]PPC77640.1 phosphoenolpyruvate-protein phosphotransferase PtsP [Pokkaliibacter plantistimulans]
MPKLETLRKIVQEVDSAETLDDALVLIVKRIRSAMSTHVCSVYLFDKDLQAFVLMATEGLHQKSVGQVSIPLHEGLVGLVGQRAEPLNLDDAAQHPQFRYFEETGEERFKSFLGVPIIHQRRVLGVLIVQQREQRKFDEGDEAFLVTMSAQLAGIIAHAEATVGIYSSTNQTETVGSESKYDGIAASPGVAIGVGVVMAPPADLTTVPQKTISEDKIALEIERFQAALKQVRRDIRAVGRTLSKRLRKDEAALFDVYLRMLDDNALPGEVISLIEEGQWAQGALCAVAMEHIRQFSLMDDPYLRERATDIRDLGRRVLSYLQEEASAEPKQFPPHTILIAEEVTPAMLGEVPPESLVGLVSVLGSSNSHAAILARSMGIPTLMGAVDLPMTQLEGQDLVLDGYMGRVFVNASRDLRHYYELIIAEERQLVVGLEAIRDLPAETLDGRSIPLWVNTAMGADVNRSLERGAEGIGLYRTEVPFMIRESFPTEAEQVQSYRVQLESFAPRSVTMRTLDIGGDKALPYFPIEEDNPFLGWRGIRVTLDHPEIFKVQVRAMLKASIGLDNLRIMLPMVSYVGEVIEAKRLINDALNELRDEGLPIARPALGVMIEVPAAVYQARDIARHVDFLSVGSNDLTQYLLAVDRNNPRVAGLYHSYHPAVLQALRCVVEDGHKEGVQVSICGEMAGDPGGAVLLMAMGYDVLSMSPIHLPKVKAAIRAVKYTEACAMLDNVMQLLDPKAVEEAIYTLLYDAGVGRLGNRRNIEAG